MIAKVLKLDESVLSISPHHGLCNSSMKSSFCRPVTLLPSQCSQTSSSSCLYGTHIQGDGQCLAWWYPAGRVQVVQLPHRDAHPLGTQVSSHDGNPHHLSPRCTWTSCSGQFFSTSYTWPLSDGDEQALWSLEGQSKLLACQAHGGVYTMGISSSVFSDKPCKAASHSS